jgi:plasmid maintenance system antidote protein VapI
MPDALTLLAFLKSRGANQEAAAVLGDCDPSTIYRIVTGQAHASPWTIVKLAKAFGVGAKRMQTMCEAHWLEAHPEERVSA